jgi:hypothetical protein
LTTERILPAPDLGEPAESRPALRILPDAGARDPGAPGARSAASALRPARTAGASPSGVLPFVRAASASAMPFRSAAHAARVAAAKRGSLLDTPSRAGLLIGVSAAVYAVSLAAVSGLQFQTDAANAAAAAPMVSALGRTRAVNDALDALLRAADARARAVAAEYDAFGGDATAYQQQLDGLAALVADVRGSAAALPVTISLPKVVTHGAIAGAAPATSGVTSASGKP